MHVTAVPTSFLGGATSSKIATTCRSGIRRDPAAKPGRRLPAHVRHDRRVPSAAADCRRQRAGRSPRLGQRVLAYFTDQWRVGPADVPTSACDTTASMLPRAVSKPAAGIFARLHVPGRRGRHLELPRAARSGRVDVAGNARPIVKTRTGGSIQSSISRPRSTGPRCNDHLPLARSEPEQCLDTGEVNLDINGADFSQHHERVEHDPQPDLELRTCGDHRLARARGCGRHGRPRSLHAQTARQRLRSVNVLRP